MNQESKIITPLHNNYTKLAKVYRMKREKFSWLIEPIRDEIKQEDPFRNILTWKEIWIIVEYLGIPDLFDGIDPLIYNSITKLADLYRVDKYTISRWIIPIKHKLKIEDPNRKKLTPAEVRMIVDHIGLPNMPENKSIKEIKGEFSAQAPKTKKPLSLFWRK